MHASRNTTAFARLAYSLAFGLTASVAFAQEVIPPVPGEGSTADHSKFEILQQEFKSGPEVTAACLSCHTEADDQVMHSIHFQWEFDNPVTGQTLGKSKVINAFCGNVVGNEPRCTSCHAGYGWDDMHSAPPQQSTAVDCLVCHDQSGQYAKLSTGAGHPPLGDVPGEPVKGQTITGADAWAVDLMKSAQSVGMPTRENCGQCHFYGGGGDNVKHGDLSSALYDPDIHTDVHMSKDGANMVCSDCHTEESHNWAGSRYLMDAKDTIGTGEPGEHRFSASCESCHSDSPHEGDLMAIKLNDHVDKVACQTCHIPEFARGGVATKTYWDWSTAGRLNAEGQPIAEHNFTQSDGQELHTYLTIKGDFEWGENVEPYYAWFNGAVDYTLPEEEIDPTQVVEINKVLGTPDGEDSRIWPFKRMVGRQSYDAGYNKLAYSHVWGPTTDTAFWTNYDWGKAIEAGMKAAGSPYSGEYGFIDTYMYWPITHMVAPADEAMDCAECHAEDGRLVGLAGVVMPGTNPNSIVGRLGQLLVLLSALGVVGHGLLRLLSRGKGGTH
ncbi:tetrathionate reductase family octaheme c-type cytochrome [Celeribacter ethanolicus]|uniref:tetrathionate reductase family octaheme c-type cytochrome n=1 Tax=Celeribacter ethanolicus TaxID=1758178 RepID=UPI000835442A|nr:tetrathionate reductase family octaheme c-type cytochrome [Celeribacter ethanolicus]